MRPWSRTKILERWIGENANRIEALGLVLILGSVGWQIFVEDPISAEIPRGYFVVLNEQIIMIWQALGSGNPEKFAAENHAYVWEAHEWASNPSVWHLDFFTGVKAALFIIGSSMTIVAKWFAPNR